MESPSEISDILKKIWLRVFEEQKQCEAKQCTGGRAAALNIRRYIENEFSEYL